MENNMKPTAKKKSTKVKKVAKPQKQKPAHGFSPEDLDKAIMRRLKSSKLKERRNYEQRAHNPIDISPNKQYTKNTHADYRKYIAPSADNTPQIEGNDWC